MAFMFQGAMQLAEENRAREQERKDKLISFKTSALESYLKNRSARGGNAAQKSADLLALSKILPENSPILSELSGASAKTIKGVKDAVYANRDAYSSSNMTYTPEMAEDELEISRVEIQNNPDLDLADFYKDAFGLTDEDLDDTTGGLTLREMLNTPETSDIGVSYSIKKPPGLNDPGKLEKFQTAFNSQLKPFINNRIKRNNALITDDNPDSMALSEENTRLEQALEALKGDFPDYTAAAKFVGPEPAIKLMETFPQYKDFRVYINQGLIFSDDEQGHELVAKAVRAGLLQIGDIYQIGNELRRINQALIDAASGS
jgi:hypothetical protein